MSAVTGISGIQLSAASAAYAPTNSADVSAIASAYAESAASSKLDESATADFYSTSNPSGFITGVDLSDYATTAYVDSSVSGKQDTLTFGYDSNKISAINGSALAGGGGGGGGSTISTGEFLGYTVVSADNGVSVVGNSGVISSSVSIPYTDTTWATNTISANSNKGQFRIYNFSRTAGNMTSLPTGNSVRIRVTAATPNQVVYSDDQIHLIVYTGTNSGSPIGNWQVQSVNGYKSAIWDKTVTWNSTNQPNMLITAENFNTYTFSTTALYSAVGVGSSASESSYTADVLAAHPSYVSSVASAYAESAVSSYALSADVSGTVDLVSTQSANWGGSALALSAGPGVKLEKSGNVLVASTDETVLWSGACLMQGGAAATLSEAASNFNKIEVYAIPNPSNSFASPQCFTYPGNNTAGAYMCPFMTTGQKGKFSYGRWTITNGTSFNLTDAGQTDSYPTMNYDNSYGGVVKVVGINRTAEA